MIFAPSPKKIRVMLTAFRDGLQSVFGGNVRVDDVLPAMQAPPEWVSAILNLAAAPAIRLPTSTPAKI
ncbi:MAG: hypothetical protein HC889_19270, partial [Synechococcaceae cyanobacterium SM1_2_3]|nr:hypothetical protein [Synechococcaceae cyanobacterium SM1_2_3]